MPSAATAPPKSPHCTPALTISDRSTCASISVATIDAPTSARPPYSAGKTAGDPQLDGELVQQPGDPFACLIDGLAVYREEALIEVVAVRVPDCGPRSVEHLLQAGEVDVAGRVGHGHPLADRTYG